MYSCFTLFSCFTSFEKVLLGSTKRTSYQFYYFLLFYISLYISRYLADIKICCFYILLNWLCTSKGGNRIHNFIIFPTYCSHVWGHVSNHIWWPTLLFIRFYHISQWSIFHLVCSHVSCCSNSHCTQVPQQSWACKIIVQGDVIIRGLHHRKFAD